VREILKKMVIAVSMQNKIFISEGLPSLFALQKERGRG